MNTINSASLPTRPLRLRLVMEPQAPIAMNNIRPEWYQLRDALAQADFVAAAALLEREPRLIDERNGIGETVLHFLAVENHQPAVEWLHAKSASLNATNEFGIPLLFEVAELGYRDLLMWLLQHGADPKKKNADGQSLEEHLTECGMADMNAFIKEHIRPLPPPHPL